MVSPCCTYQGNKNPFRSSSVIALVVAPVDIGLGIITQKARWSGTRLRSPSSRVGDSGLEREGPNNIHIGSRAVCKRFWATQNLVGPRGEGSSRTATTRASTPASSRSKQVFEVNAQVKTREVTKETAITEGQGQRPPKDQKDIDAGAARVRVELVAEDVDIAVNQSACRSTKTWCTKPGPQGVAGSLG